MLTIYLLIFWSLQILANVAFKYGSFGQVGKSRRWYAGFIGGNIVGGTSIFFLMKIFHEIPGNSNVASVLAGSGAFIGSQILLSILFRSRLAAIQWVGIIVIAAGTALATLGGPVVQK
jgi:multidrug transporter EmrE-like cation transporter